MKLIEKIHRDSELLTYVKITAFHRKSLQGKSVCRKMQSRDL